jgi:TatD DNase family protein
LADPQLLGDVDAVVARAEAAGVERILAVGVDLSTSQTCVALADRFGSVFAAVGIHPHDAADVDGSSLEELRRLAAHPKVVAIGETGLDYVRSTATAETQRAAFAAQAGLAAKLELPVVIHNRSADADVIAIVSETTRPAGLTDRAGVLHCFTGDVALAQLARERGLRISFAGNITYRRSGELRSVAAAIPLDWLLTETDSPYLTPDPHRGTANSPSKVELVVRKVADVRGVPVEDVAIRVRENARQLFGWPLAGD